jgi:hypothetical protein
MTGGWRSVGISILSHTASKYRSVVGFADDHFCCRAFLLQDTRNALERAARSNTGNPIIERDVVEIVEDFLRRRSGMKVRIGFVFELPAKEPAISLGQFDGFS